LAIFNINARRESFCVKSVASVHTEEVADTAEFASDLTSSSLLTLGDRGERGDNGGDAKPDFGERDACGLSLINLFEADGDLYMVIFTFDFGRGGDEISFGDERLILTLSGDRMRTGVTERPRERLLTTRGFMVGSLFSMSEEEFVL
jgi:hypothetical protein